MGCVPSHQPKKEEMEFSFLSPTFFWGGFLSVTDEMTILKKIKYNLEKERKEKEKDEKKMGFIIHL